MARHKFYLMGMAVFLAGAGLSAQTVKQPSLAQLVPGVSCVTAFNSMSESLCSNPVATKATLASAYNALATGQFKTALGNYYKSKYGSLPAQTNTGTASNMLAAQVSQLSKENAQLSKDITALENQLNKIKGGGATPLELRQQLTNLKNQYYQANRTISNIQSALQKSQQDALKATQTMNDYKAALWFLKTALAQYLNSEKKLKDTYNQYKESISGSIDYPSTTIASMLDQLEKNWTAYQQAIIGLNNNLSRQGMADLQVTVDAALAAMVKGALASASAFK